MTSSRLPGKGLKEILGKPTLHHMIDRLKRIRGISGIIIATTTNTADDPIVELASKLNVRSFRGDEEDVLGRVVKAAQHFDTDIIVQITGDSTLVDPEVSQRVLDVYLQKNDPLNYVCNDLVYTYPIGLNTHVFSSELLSSIEPLAIEQKDREHVVRYFLRNQQSFKIVALEAEEPYRRPEVRLTLDTEEDFQLIKSVYGALYPLNPAFSISDILQFLDANPEVSAINKEVVQRSPL